MNKILILLFVLISSTGMAQTSSFLAVSTSYKEEDKNWSVPDSVSIPVYINYSNNRILIFSSTTQIIDYVNLIPEEDGVAFYSSLATDSNFLIIYITFYRLVNNDVYLEVHYSNVMIRYKLIPII
jgi:hypothetical protein